MWTHDPPFEGGTARFGGSWEGEKKASRARVQEDSAPAGRQGIPEEGRAKRSVAPMMQDTPTVLWRVETHPLVTGALTRTFLLKTDMQLSHLFAPSRILLPSAVHLEERLTVSQSVPEPGQQSVRQKHTVWVCQWQMRPQAVGRRFTSYQAVAEQQSAVRTPVG